MEISMFSKYVNILKENNLKITPQRIEILQYIDKHRNHPTVEEIHSFLKKNNPSLSKTTVYNSVETLKKYEIIQSLTITGSEIRYDYRNDTHHHFICKKCRNIIDIDLSCPNQKKKIIEGHRVDKVQGYFIGVCKKCLSKE